jgi:hypothetical protein
MTQMKASVKMGAVIALRGAFGPPPVNSGSSVAARSAALSPVDKFEKSLPMRLRRSPIQIST